MLYGECQACLTNAVQYANFRNMKVEDIVPEHFRSFDDLASALHITKSAVSQWKKNGAIPFDRQCQIQVVTDGRVLANKERVAA